MYAVVWSLRFTSDESNIALRRNAMTPLDRPGGSPRRIVLIDFDWQDADHLPSLLRMPGVAIRLVAGTSTEDAGVRIASLCGLPRSVELADLTREIFDVALVSERSPRLEQLDRLLRALGTPIESPQQFLRNGHHEERRERCNDPATDAAPDVETFATSGWLPEGLAPSAAGTEAMGERIVVLPPPEDPLGLERCLANWVAETSASSASIHHAAGEGLTRLCRFGPEDPLLESLVALAFRLDTPHVMRREDGAQRGRLWAAWPFHTEHRRAVVAVAGADGAMARAVWESAVQSLCVAWSVAEHGEVAETPRLTLFEPAAFTHRLQMAVDRHHAEGFRFALYRLSFTGPEDALTALLAELPERLRGTDCVCRPAPDELLLLCAGSTRAYQQVRRRIEFLWRQACGSLGDAAGASLIHDERIELSGLPGAAETHDFLSSAQDWVGGGDSRG